MGARSGGVCQSVRVSVRPSVRPSVLPSVLHGPYISPSRFQFIVAICSRYLRPCLLNGRLRYALGRQLLALLPRMVPIILIWMMIWMMMAQMDHVLMVRRRRLIILASMTGAPGFVPIGGNG